MRHQSQQSLCLIDRRLLRLESWSHAFWLCVGGVIDARGSQNLFPNVEQRSLLYTTHDKRKFTALYKLTQMATPSPWAALTTHTARTPPDCSDQIFVLHAGSTDAAAQVFLFSNFVRSYGSEACWLRMIVIQPGFYTEDFDNKVWHSSAVQSRFRTDQTSKFCIVIRSHQTNARLL